MGSKMTLGACCQLRCHSEFQLRSAELLKHLCRPDCSTAEVFGCVRRHKRNVDTELTLQGVKQASARLCHQADGDLDAKAGRPQSGAKHCS